MYKSRIQNGKSRNNRDEKRRDMIFPDDDQEYGIVQEMLGNGRVRILCNDKVTRMGRICGKMRKYRSKVIIESGDLVIISKRDYEEDKVDVIHKYAFDEANYLAYNEYLPEYIVKVYTKSEVGMDSKTETNPNGQFIVFANDEDEFQGNKKEDIDLEDI